MALVQEPTPEYVGSEVVEEIEAAGKSQAEAEEKPREREPRLAVIMIIVTLVIFMILALFPQIHTSVIETVTASYNFVR
jgi:hypothetical protein